MGQTEGQEQDARGDLFHDDLTMKKVYDAMESAGIDIVTATAAVTQMQNLGILFRERGKF